MKRIIYVVVALVSLTACNKHSTTKADITPKTISLKDRINSAQEKTYHDKVYNVTVPYLDFFDADTTEAGTARFEYRFENAYIRLTMFVEPNVEGWNIKEAVNNLAVGSERCLEETDKFFIMTGEMSEAPGYSFVEKCFLVAHKWIDFTVYYPTDKADDVERFIDMVKKWNP